MKKSRKKRKRSTARREGEVREGSNRQGGEDRSAEAPAGRARPTVSEQLRDHFLVEVGPGEANWCPLCHDGFVTVAEDDVSGRCEGCGHVFVAGMEPPMERSAPTLKEAGGVLYRLLQVRRRATNEGWPAHVRLAAYELVMHLGGQPEWSSSSEEVRLATGLSRDKTREALKALVGDGREVKCKIAHWEKDSEAKYRLRERVEDNVVGGLFESTFGHEAFGRGTSGKMITRIRFRPRPSRAEHVSKLIHPICGPRGHGPDLARAKPRTPDEDGETETAV